MESEIITIFGMAEINPVREDIGRWFLLLMD
mgnify:FL=1